MVSYKIKGKRRKKGNDKKNSRSKKGDEKENECNKREINGVVEKNNK